MPATVTEETVQVLSVTKEVQIAAPIGIAFDAILEEMGPGGQMPGGEPFPMVVEAWPGGRWYRDLGNNTGHWWGHIQVIKPPRLLEVCGPLFMSYPAISHVQYRLSEEGGGTRLRLVHRAIGLITPEHREGVDEGWQFEIDRIRQVAERNAAARGGSTR